MAVTERLRHGDTIEKALRRLKRKVDAGGALKAIKAGRYYMKPSEKKRLKSKAAQKRTKLAARRGYA